ncbi:response regulator [Dyadobacter endophyticus]|uniref:response regulator n=1 Tax=Dyadobacter endophyticus TaxID=1749036 RepID=UPI003CF54F80
MQEDEQTKILLIDDHEIVLWALTAIVRESIPEASLFSASSFDQGLGIVAKSSIDLVVLDIDVPGGNSPKMIESLRNVYAPVRILVHSAMNEEDFSVKYLSAGADGFLSKSAPFTAIARAMRMVLNGEKYMSSQTQSYLAHNYLKSISNPNKHKEAAVITPREAEIIRLLLQGKWTKEIAGQLGIKWSTVSTHKLSIFEKFGVTNVIQLYKKIEKENPELLNIEVQKKA